MKTLILFIISVAWAILQTKPEKVIELAVKGMLPKNTLGRQMFKKLKVYAGPEHFFIRNSF